MYFISVSAGSVNILNNNNNNDLLCANILEDQARWRDRIMGLCNLVIVVNAHVLVDGWMIVPGS